MKQARNAGRLRRIAYCVAVAGLFPACAQATEMMYVPVNPMFGGSPLNGSVLLNNAQAENRKKDPEAAISAAQTSNSALQDFNNTLQRSILSRLASAATSNILGNSGQLTPGTVETGDFRIAIVDTGNGVLSVTTTDKVTGNATTFQVGK